MVLLNFADFVDAAKQLILYLIDRSVKTSFWFKKKHPYFFLKRNSFEYLVLFISDGVLNFETTVFVKYRKMFNCPENFNILCQK